MRFVYVAGACVSALWLSGCATSPDAVQPSYVTTVTYESWTCKQLSEEDARLTEAYAIAAATQNQTRSSDTLGVFLLGLPLGSMSGGNIAPQIASLKGQQEAVHKTEIVKSCASAG